METYANTRYYRASERKGWYLSDLLHAARYCPTVFVLDNYTTKEYLMISTFIEPFTGEVKYICRYCRIDDEYPIDETNTFSYGDAKGWIEQF